MPTRGDRSLCLGVRVPGGPGKPDIIPDASGAVAPRTGGLSVSSGFAALVVRLPSPMIPRRLRHLADEPGFSPRVRRSLQNAEGSDSLRVWELGEGAFVVAAVSPDLALRVDSSDVSHGFVEPARSMRLEEYQEALADTRPDWRDGEPHVSEVSE